MARQTASMKKTHTHYFQTYKDKALAEENVRFKRQLAEKSEELEIAEKPRCISPRA